MSTQKKEAASAIYQSSMRANPADLYEHDYYTWTTQQARVLRERQVSTLDWVNLAEEVEDLGKTERHRLESHLELVLMHLLKWVYEPERRIRSWSNSIEEHRFRVHRVLRDNPGLKSKLSEIFAGAYNAARFAARRETALDLSMFPESCPWSLDDVMRDDFWPGGLPKQK